MFAEKKMNLIEGVSLKDKLRIIMYFSYMYDPLRYKLVADCLADNFIRQSSRNSRPNCSEGQTGNHRPNKESRIYSDRKRLLDCWVPEIGKLGYIYYTISTLAHAINVATSSLLAYHGNETAHKLEGGPLAFACYMPRLVIHEYFGSTTLIWLSLIFSSLHFWGRLYIMCHRGRLAFNPILFLLLDPEQYSRLANQPESARQFYLKHLKVHPFHRVLFYTANDGMYNIKFRLRPNREPLARAKLGQLVAENFQLGVVTLLAVSVIFTAVGSWSLATNLPSFYPGCTLTVGPNWTFIHCLLLSTSFSVMTLVDSFGSLMFGPVGGAILIVDMNMYWTHIELELRKLTLLMSTQPPSVLTTSRDDKSFIMDDMIAQVQDNYIIRLDKRNHELQAMICDFFAQLQEADQWIAVLLRLSLTAWLICNAVFTFTDLQPTRLNQSVVIYLIQAIQVSGLWVIFTESLLILRLKRATESAYHKVANIMAHDQSMDKTRWLSIMKYYTSRPRHAFTLFQSQVYSLGSLLKTLSYTFTSALFLRQINRSVR